MRIFIAAITLMHLATAGSALAAESAATAEYQAAMQHMHKEMKREMSGDTDTDFAAGMIPHHQAAVAMAETELKYGKDPLLRWLAGAIIVAQEEEIGMLQQWMRGRAYLFRDPDAASTPELKAADEKMHHTMMAVEYTGDPDTDFVLGMIPHHQGAIDMAEVQIRYGRTKELNDMAMHIAESQAQEIWLMEQWLGDRE